MSVAVLLLFLRSQALHLTRHKDAFPAPEKFGALLWGHIVKTALAFVVAQEIHTHADKDHTKDKGEQAFAAQGNGHHDDGHHKIDHCCRKIDRLTPFHCSSSSGWTCSPAQIHAILIVPCFNIYFHPGRQARAGSERSHTMEFEYTCPSLWKDLDDTSRQALFAYGERYKAFLDQGKTERECAANIVAQAHDAGFIDLADVLARGEKPVPGTKIVLNHKNKAVVLFVIGQAPLESGMHIVGAHIDAPRLDLKGHPLYEEGELALLKTHYYGGIKKYQWTCMPLALHGVVYREDGTAVNVRLGDEAGDPVLYITDLLPHLARRQNDSKLAEAITGEQLNAIIGHIPVDDEDEKEPVKAAVLAALHDKYGFIEEDLLLAELELVPAQNAVDVGLDRGLIAAHGHDDRSCAFAAFDALLHLDHTPQQTAVGLFVDKEEIGSVGNTSMSARYFENALAELFALEDKDTELSVRRALAASSVLSADVTAALDPTFPDVMDKRNTAVLGKGVSLCKFTGARGKSGSNDANAEFLARLRGAFKAAGVPWQAGELGRVDEGGGGTIAYILAERGAEVVDCGVPMLSMHAPVELASKADVYFTMRAYKAFFEAVL